MGGCPCRWQRRGGVTLLTSLGCWGVAGEDPSLWYQLVLCLQEKEIMKELMENGPVQGRELLGTLCKKANYLKVNESYLQSSVKG